MSFFSLGQHFKSDYWLKPWNTTQIPSHFCLSGAFIVSFTHARDRNTERSWYFRIRIETLCARTQIKVIKQGKFKNMCVTETEGKRKKSVSEAYFQLQSEYELMSVSEWSISVSGLLLAQETPPNLCPNICFAHTRLFVYTHTLTYIHRYTAFCPESGVDQWSNSNHISFTMCLCLPECVKERGGGWELGLSNFIIQSSASWLLL